jgi:CBS-domain-containing membrane protein
MWTYDCGSLPVIDTDGAQRIVGMITDRDICMSALFKGRPLNELIVSDAMAKDVKTCRPTDSLSAAERIMRDAQIRRLPVVDNDGALVGMLTLADLALASARARTSPKKELTGNEVGMTLASICAPAHQRFAA